MGSLTMPRVVPPALHQNLSMLSQFSGGSMLSKCLSYRPQIQPGRFAVSAVLYSGAQVNQSAKFVDASKRGNLTPLHQCIYADQLTPVLAYRCLVDENDHETPSFLFESVESQMESSTVGRYSVIGANPAMEIIAKKNSVTVVNHLEGWTTEEHSEEPMMIAQRITEKLNPLLMDELPQVFCGGWVGYFSYDTVRYAKKRLTFSSAHVDDMNLPDVNLGLYDDVLVFDHVEKKIYVIHWVQLDRFSSAEEALNNGTDRLQSLLSKVYDIVNPRLPAGLIELDAHNRRPSKVELLSTESETYMKSILKAKEHIVAGDVNQLALSQRYIRKTFSDPFEVYRTLGVVNPSPFMAYLQVKGSILVASGHEFVTHVEPKRKTFNGFHAGNESKVGRPENAVHGKQFFNGEKHYRDQIMLSDLTNDVVRKVNNVGSTWWDTLQSALPIKTVTGSSTNKAMELIDELEVNRRALYGGGIGSISFSGNMDIAIAPKTIVFPTQNNHDTILPLNPKKQQEWHAHIHAGATIFPDSDPSDVVRECKSEAQAVARAIDLAESSFLH